MMRNQKPVQFAGRTYAPIQKSGSGCGANTDGGGGFQQGNTCGSSSGGGGGGSKPAAGNLTIVGEKPAPIQTLGGGGRKLTESNVTVVGEKPPAVQTFGGGGRKLTESNVTIVGDDTARVMTFGGKDTKPASSVKPSAKQTAKPKAPKGVKVNPQHTQVYAGEKATVKQVGTMSDGRKIYALKTAGGTVASAVDSDHGLFDYAEQQRMKVEGSKPSKADKKPAKEPAKKTEGGKGSEVKGSGVVPASYSGKGKTVHDSGNDLKRFAEQAGIAGIKTEYTAGAKQLSVKIPTSSPADHGDTLRAIAKDMKIKIEVSADASMDPLMSKAGKDLMRQQVKDRMNGRGKKAKPE